MSIILDDIKPISTATSDALLLKEDLLNKKVHGKFLSKMRSIHQREPQKTYIDAAVVFRCC
jgi:hypothetical protein